MSTEEKEKIELIQLLMSARLFDNQEDIAETIEEGLQWAMDLFHVKKGYKDADGIFVRNPDFDLLRVWISNQTGFYWDGTSWVMTMQEKARQRFG